MVISFRAPDFTRVFDIPGHAQGGKKIDRKLKKLNQEVNVFLIELVCVELS